MEKSEFKKIFDKIAKKFNFEKAFQGWFKVSNEVIHLLDLQKSNYGNYYYLNIKFFIQGTFGRTYIKCKNLVKNDVADIDLRQPNEYNLLFDLDNNMNAQIREEGLQKFFNEYLDPLCCQTSSKDGIKALNTSGGLYIDGAVKEELGIPLQ